MARPAGPVRWRAHLDLAAGARGRAGAVATLGRGAGGLQPVHLAARLPGHLPGRAAQSPADRSCRPRRPSADVAAVLGEAAGCRGRSWSATPTSAHFQVSPAVPAAIRRRPCAATPSGRPRPPATPRWPGSRRGTSRRAPATPPAAPACRSAHARTLRQLATGAQLLGERLQAELDGGLAAIARIVCSVPPQHMFGLECSVMLPLVHGIAGAGGPAAAARRRRRRVRRTRRRRACLGDDAHAPARPGPSGDAGVGLPRGDRLDHAAGRRRRRARRGAGARAGARDLRLDRDRRAGDAPHRRASRAGGRSTACSWRPRDDVDHRPRQRTSRRRSAERRAEPSPTASSPCSAARATWSRSPAGGRR